MDSTPQDKHTYLGKRRIGNTDISYFTDIQGIGRDPLYRRYASVAGIAGRVIAPRYSHFLAAPHYSATDDTVNWYIEEWNETPVRLTRLQGAEAQHYRTVLAETLSHWRGVLATLSGEDLMIMTRVLKYVHEDFVYCADGKVYLMGWGMTPDPAHHKTIGELVREAPYIVRHTVTFEPGQHGHFADDAKTTIQIPDGLNVPAEMFPRVVSDEDFELTGWSPEASTPVNEDMTFTAQYREQVVAPPPFVEAPPVVVPPRMYTVTFDPDVYGSLHGEGVIERPEGYVLTEKDIPIVAPDKGYKWTGWTASALGWRVDGDRTFLAQYEQKAKWYAGCIGLGWLKGCLLALLGLLGLLLFLLLLSWLLSWLFPGCGFMGGLLPGCNRETNGVVEGGTIIGADGDTIDDNGGVKPILLDDGRLPDEENVVAPVRDEDGRLPEIVKQPGMPPVFADRLFLFMEDENGDLDGLARDFTAAYPESEGFGIIGFDREVKSMVIQVPADRRDEVRSSINRRLPHHQFIVFDESIYELNAANVSITPLAAQGSYTLSDGWHLEAVQAPRAWKITKGDRKVRVAVVDDGIDPSHGMFTGRIVDAYNVFTQNNHLSIGSGHGTHTAGIAVGSVEYLSKGAAGIAPECMLMPVQVFDNGMCPMSALVSGIMYAVHHEADVINVSVGPTFQGLNALPVEAQEQIGRERFRNEQQLWTRVTALAAARNTIVIFAVGNDDILSSIPPENRSRTAITVGAVDHRRYPTVFTNYGPDTDISAPGTQILSAAPGNDFMTQDGTSMAAPIVSGAVALMKTLKPDITVEQAYNVLYRTGQNVYGWMPPMVQIADALEGVRRGDFSKGPEREIESVPDNAEVHLPGNGEGGSVVPPDSWRMPTEAELIQIIGGGQDVIVGDDPGQQMQPVQPVPGQPIPGQQANPLPPQQGKQPADETDYEAIRRMIREYQQKIAELEKQLPENRR